MKLKQFIFAFMAMLLCFSVSVNAQVAKIGGTEYTTLADALDAAKAKTGDVTVELYEKVTLNQPLNGSFTTITFVGKDTDAEIYLDVQGYITATGKKVSFTDLKLSKSEGGFITNAGFMNVAFGVYDVAEVTYTNCTFANGAYASSGKVTYDGCTFKKSWDKYGLWAYGNVDVTVQGSTFADYRGIKMYAENGADASVEKANLTVKNTNFSAVDNKPAIVLTYGESVVLEGNTYSSTGTFELDLDGKPNGVAVTSDVAPVCVNDNGACGVLVDGKIYTTVAQAAEVATAGSTVTLLHNSTETVKFPEGVTLNKNGFTANGVTVVAVAKIGDVEYATLQAALDAAAAGTGNVTVTILADVDLTGVDWNPVTVSAPGYPVVTVEGNGKTITDLNDMLFAGTWAGKSGLIIKNLTIANSAIVNDKDDAKGTVGVGAFIGYPQASATITLENCHLKNSSVEGGHWTGGLIGMAGGYNGADGPVFMNLTIKGCSVTGSTITGKGSVGGVIGHGSCAAWTNVVIEKTTVSDNTITSTGSSNVKAGAVMGTIGAAGQPTTVNGVTHTGGMSVSATVATNTVKSNGTEITTIYGRQGTPTGMLAVAGGSYDNYPIEKGVAYAAPAKGYKIEQNTNGTYGVVVDPAYGKVAKIGNEYYANFEEAFAAVQAGETLTLLADLNMSDILTINKAITLDGNGKTLTYTGNGTSARAIDVPANADAKVNVTIENLTVDCTASYCQRGINYNDDGALTLNKVTVKGTNVTYALNLPGSSDNAVVTINESNLSGNIALNVWGENSTINATNTTFTAVDNSTAEGYAAVKLNNDGTTSAEGTVITITGGKIDVTGSACTDTEAVSNGTSTGTINISDNTVVNGEVATMVAVIRYADGNSYSFTKLEDAIAKATAGDVITMLRDVKASDIITINKAITLDGNGKTLTSTAGRAINVSGANGVTIKNLTINASGERAINVIQNATNVTIDSVTATAANYTVNVAASAPNAVVAIKNSNLTGLNVVNVAAPKADVTIDNTIITTVDNASTEGYSAICLNKDAVNGKIVATNTTVNITGSAASDSKKAKNGAEGGYVSLNGSTEGVSIDVAYISYGDTYYGFATIEAAIEKAEAGETVTLLHDVTIAEKITIAKSITLDGNGKTITYTGNGASARAIDVPATEDAELEVTIKNLTVDCTSSYCQRGINYNEDGKFTLEGVTVKGTNVTYALNLPGSSDNAVVTINESNLSGNIALNVWGENSTINATNTTFTAVDNSTAEGYAAVKLNNDGTTSAEGTVITITGGKIDVTGSACTDTEATSNGTSTGKINISESTVVNGENAEMVAVIRYADGNSYSFTTIEAAIAKAEAGETVVLINNVTASEIITINKAITLDGNGKTLTSTAGRAINIETEGKVVINNLTVNAAERAFNIINKAATVELDGVTATAKNNAVMVATSAGAAKVTINDCDFTGLAVVNVAGAKSVVAIKNSKITNVDTNPAENYGAITVWTSAEEAVVNVENTTITVADDSKKAYVFPADATVNGVDEVSYIVATVGDAGYETLEAALAAEGNRVELLVPYVVAAGETVELDLKGKTVSQSKACTASYEMINNKGNLTIKNGTLSFTDTSAGDPNFGWGSYTVRNEGTLVVEDGTTIEHKGAQTFATHMICAIFQYSGSTTINGGTISTPNYRSVRLWKGEMTINGGTFDGQVWVQAVDNTAKLTINDGTFEPNGGDASAVFVTNITYDVAFAVTGGTFNGKVGCSDATKLAGAITGGKFNEAAKNGTNAALLATGFIFGEADTDGYYTVVDDPSTLYIANLDDLKAFRDAVNNGTNYYAGVNVYLAADIDMTGENWVGIGTATKDHGFMGNFDGQGYKIKNLTITNPTLESDGYAYAGLFGVTEGTDKDNQNTIKNLTIENVTITTTGHIAAAAVAYPYYTIIDNVKVCGDIKIQGGNYTAGVLAYTRRCVNASKLSIVGNDGSFVKGNQTVGGVISDIQMNGGLTAVYNNFSAEDLTISGAKQVGGISGIIATQTLVGAIVKNVTLECSDARVGIVSGCLGGTSTISNVTYENVTGATALIGASYDGAKAVQAKIGDTYYASLDAALAAKGNEVVELLVPYVVAKGETVTLDLNGKTVTGTPSEAKAYAVITNYGTLTISNGSVICNHTLAGSTGYAVNTITNCGTLTIEDATIENKSTAQYQIGYAIDNNSTSADAVVNIKGGKVIASGSLYYDGIRQFCNSQTKENSIVVSGGEVSTIWMQNPSDGGTKNTKDVKGSIAISGGKVGVLSLEPSANFEAAVTGGHFGEISYFQTAEGRDLKGFITGGTFDKLIDETFLAMGYQLTGDAAPYTVAYTGKVTKLELVDGEFTEFVNEKEVTVDTLTYKRNVLKTWVPIYVPFEIPVSMLAEKFYVARINDVRRTDNNNDGELDDFDMEIIFIHGGNADGSGKTLKANYPYFIKSKSGKTETMEITLTGATLYAAKENVFDCTTMTEKFEIKGNCRLMQANEFDPKNQYTVLTTGEWGHTTSALKPFRFYMTKSSRYEDEPAAPMNSMRITVRGEEDENGATIIYDVVEDSLNNNDNDFIYDLQGRRVSEPKKGGIYIKNGKKILF